MLNDYAHFPEASARSYLEVTANHILNICIIIC